MLAPSTVRVAVFALEAHRGQLDRDGSEHFEHVRRVAEMVPDDCERVAYLHDVIEDTPHTWEDLRDLGVPHVEIEAIRLLTRPTGQQALDWGVTRPTYREFITNIAWAPGDAGAIARVVKEADMLDNLTRSLRSRDASVRSLADRYRRHLPVIQAALR